MSTVLIIDDDPYVRRFYEKIFRFSNFEVLLAEDGEEGIASAKEAKPDLILLDIMMPKMNGLEVLKILKSDPETDEFSVLILTNLNDIEISRQAMALGAGGVIVKSNIPPVELVEKVKDYIDKDESQH